MAAEAQYRQAGKGVVRACQARRYRPPWRASASGDRREYAIATGKVTARCQPRIEVRDWLAANPRVSVHFTPTSASWMNMVEIWFGLIERQAIHRGSVDSVKDLNAKIRAFTDGWNDRAHSFVWTKTADQILTKAKRPATINSGH